MRSALSLTVIVALVGSSVPLVAQESVTLGPLAQAMTREAVRLAATPHQNQPSDVAWSKVQKIVAGTRPSS
jgi:hypothetical protein